MADVFHALSSPVRRKILSMLKSRDMTAGEIADRLDVSKSTLSGHFNVLKAADLIYSERDGTTLTYSINTSVTEELLASIIELLSNNQKGDSHE